MAHIINSLKGMGDVDEDVDMDFVFPYLVFLYNSMAKQEELRVAFVTSPDLRQGLESLVTFFLSLNVD